MVARHSIQTQKQNTGNAYSKGTIASTAFPRSESLPVLSTFARLTISRTYTCIPNFTADNYRGVHLTSQLSKVVERLIGLSLLPYISHPLRTGSHQFAYVKQKGSKDALAILTLSWIAALNDRRKIAVLCSDVSGAFDRVSRERILSKLRASGITRELFSVLESWLDDRDATVLVGGECSSQFLLRNQVFQGTVWGPALWNIFFASVLEAASEAGFESLAFADDLNSLKIFSEATPNARVYDELAECQTRIHEWGLANQVTFDPKKESLHVISRSQPAGDNIKLLGVVFDMHLKMIAEIEPVVQKAHWKVTTLLRMRKYLSCNDILIEYKARVLSILECRTAAIYHAADSYLDRFDQVQKRLLTAIGISEECALISHNLAPLVVRRDIAMLGMIQKTVLGEAHEAFSTFFTLTENDRRKRTRFQHNKHIYQLADRRNGLQLEMWQNSVFGLIPIYNELSDEIAMSPTVSAFQKSLQKKIKALASDGVRNWRQHFSPKSRKRP